MKSPGAGKPPASLPKPGSGTQLVEPSLVEILKATQAETDDILRLSRTTPWEKSDYLRRQVARGHVSVARDGDRVLGFAAWNREFFSKAFIWLVVVSPERRGQGIGNALFAAVEMQCAGSRVYSSTNRSNTAMQRFLQQRGYRFAGEVDLDPGDPELFYYLDA
jgi:GNAT superfamily N-acetyltransferase